MEDVIYGLLAIVFGALFCFRGYLAFRFIIPLWGAFVGFSLGAGLIAATTDEGFLRTALGWLVGLGVAVAFALIAYLFYEVAVVIAMGSIGFALGTALMVAIDVSWTWVIVLVGVALGALLAFAAIVADLPMALLVALSALGGASAMTAGIMLLAGAVDTEDFTTDAATSARADNDWWWYVLYVLFAVFGIVSQVRSAAELRRSMRESWSAERAAA
jgi:hypothetical protein